MLISTKKTIPHNTYCDVVGFTNINALQSDKNIKLMEELTKINSTLYYLQITMRRYIDDSRVIWNKRIKPFLHSDDCNTLQLLSANNNDSSNSSTFIKFMMTQKTYKLMVTAKTRLSKRRDYIMYQL